MFENFVWICIGITIGELITLLPIYKKYRNKFYTMIKTAAKDAALQVLEKSHK